VELAESDPIPRPETDSGTDSPKGRASGRTVAEITRDATAKRNTDVHAIATITPEDDDVATPELRTDREAAQKTFMNARRNVGPDADLVYDGTNGATINGGAGAVQHDIGQAPGFTAMPNEKREIAGAERRESRGYDEHDRALSEELLSLGSGCGLGGIAQLAGLRG